MVTRENKKTTLTGEGIEMCRKENLSKLNTKWMEVIFLFYFELP
jgi:hypothetical protein